MKERGSRFKEGYTIKQGGTLVLGQDSNGDFEAHQSFQGMLSNVNVWDYLVYNSAIKEMSESCVSAWTDHTVYKWLDFLREGGATLVKPSPCELLGMGKWPSFTIDSYKFRCTYWQNSSPLSFKRCVQ